MHSRLPNKQRSKRAYEWNGEMCQWFMIVYASFFFAMYARVHTQLTMAAAKFNSPSFIAPPPKDKNLIYYLDEAENIMQKSVNYISSNSRTECQCGASTCDVQWPHRAIVWWKKTPPNIKYIYIRVLVNNDNKNRPRQNYHYWPAAQH